MAIMIDGVDIARFGGKFLAQSESATKGAESNRVLWFGYIPQKKEETLEFVDKVIPEVGTVVENWNEKKEDEPLPIFKLDGPWQDTRERSNNYEIMKAVSQAYGFDDILKIIQLTGSCVGASGGHTRFQNTCTEIALKGEFWEQLTIPFWLLTYGKSRELGGIPGKGEGSFVSAYARAIKEVGILDANEEGLPKYTVTADGVHWSKNDELLWSNGASIPKSWTDYAKNFIASTVAEITTIEQAIAALDNGYAIHHGSSWGGKMKPPVVSDPPVLLNSYYEVWMHAMKTSDYWFHPKLGLILWIDNTWGREVHGFDPSGMPKGGFWIRGREWESKILKEGECFTYSDQKGFRLRYQQLQNVDLNSISK